MTKACRRCGGAFETKTAAQYCGAECRRLAENALQRKQYQLQIEKRREDARKWYATNAEHVNDTRRAARAKNAEYWREYHRRRYAADPDEARARGEKWRTANRETFLLSKRMTEARRRAAIALNFPLSDLASRASMFGHACWICGRDFDQWDHVKPISKGGSHMLSNLRPICGTCNLIKSARWLGPARIGQLRDAILQRNLELAA